MNLSDNALQVASKRYFYEGFDNNWHDLCVRVGTEVGRYDKEYIDKFIEMHENLEFLGAGRILRNVGRPKGNLMNCFVIPINDSIEEIGQFMKDAIQVWAVGGGIGTNLSFLRPNGATIKCKGGQSSGPISFLRAINAIGDTIKIGGMRRAAGMALMEVWHPDILDFIDAKLIDGEFSNFNISVGINEKFIEAVEKDMNWDLKFNNIVYKTVMARDIWNKIIENMVKHAEPGLLMMNNVMSNNSYYFQRIIATNPCGEQCLPPYGACNLGSINLSKFVSKTKTNWKRLEEVTRLSVRFLDNVIDINNYVLPQFKETSTEARRIGIGVMGLADFLFAKKIRYGSKESLNECEKIFKFIRNISYEESVKISVEKGSFPKFDSYDYLKSHFIRTLPMSLRTDIKKHGMRNSNITSIAPTGTLSLLAETTGGVEPLFSKAFVKNDAVSKRVYIHPVFKNEIMKTGIKPEWFVDVNDLKPENHLDIQLTIQKFIDSSISKTINMPKGTTSEQLSDIILNYIPSLKGVTVYVDGSRGEQPLKSLTDEEVIEYINKENYSSSVEEETVQCPNGKCEL
jgi:ribonucleoside-diphosphate reductase alpha chain